MHDGRDALTGSKKLANVTLIEGSRMLDILKIIHFLSLAVGIGIGVASMSLGIRAATAKGPVIGALRAAQGALGRISLGAIALMWITGIWMWMGYHGGSYSPVFTSKIAAVVVLTAFSLDLNLKGARAAKGGSPVDPAYARRSGMIMMLMSLVALVLAVLIYH
ncbi:MAG: hypothetical protein ACE5DK_04895 [Paracoccaceae bacterium]